MPASQKVKMKWLNATFASAQRGEPVNGSVIVFAKVMIKFLSFFL
jgi:hypothetical protein